MVDTGMEKGKGGEEKGRGRGRKEEHIGQLHHTFRVHTHTHTHTHKGGTGWGGERAATYCAGVAHVNVAFVVHLVCFLPTSFLFLFFLDSAVIFWSNQYLLNRVHHASIASSACQHTRILVDRVRCARISCSFVVFLVW